MSEGTPVLKSIVSPVDAQPPLVDLLLDEDVLLLEQENRLEQEDLLLLLEQSCSFVKKVFRQK